jgi:hypothetical protein
VVLLDLPLRPVVPPLRVPVMPTPIETTLLNRLPRGNGFGSWPLPTYRLPLLSLPNLSPTQARRGVHPTDVSQFTPSTFITIHMASVSDAARRRLFRPHINGVPRSDPKVQVVERGRPRPCGIATPAGAATVTPFHVAEKVRVR